MATESTVNSTRPDLQSLLEVLEEMKSLLLRKGEDYSTGSTWESFEAAGDLFDIPSESVFLALIGTKIARLKTLYQGGKTPNFEPITDTWLDLANYIVLYISYQRHKELWK